MRNPFLAGMLIGLGCCMYVTISDKIIGAICFSLGLLAIRLFRLDLYTGKTQFFLKKNSPYKPMKIFWIFINNILGVNLIFVLAGLLAPDILINAQKVGLIKDAIPIGTLIFNSIMCGALMTIAKYKLTPFWVSTLAVAAFILAGFNHSIADYFYFMTLGHGLTSLLKILIIAAGNLVGGRIAAMFEGN